MKRVILAGILVVLSLSVSYPLKAQESHQDRLNNLRNIVPPSPNASSIAKYGDLPVSLYTGLPNISVPLYTLSGKSIAVPISLSYHAGGIKVGEIASWVGLGWSLNAGGLITRSVRGIPDETPYEGYFVKRQLYTNQNDLCSYPVDVDLARQHKSFSAYQTYNNCNGCTWPDSEEDQYSLNAMGLSFKFFIKADGSIITAPYSNVKITTNFGPDVTNWDNVSWTVITENGTKLQFGGAGYVELTANPRFYLASNYYPSSWYLKSITSPEGEVIDFTYSSSVIQQDTYFSQSDYLVYNLEMAQRWYTDQVCPGYVYNYNDKSKAEKQEVIMPQLLKIESQHARIEFVQSTAERQDLKGGKYLSEVKVYSKFSNQYTDRIKLNYTYSNSVTSGEYWGGVLEADKDYYRKRLKLLNLERIDPNSSVVDNRWVFNYNSQQLPSRRSYAQDHWGFYNGKTTNNTLLPKYFFPLPLSVLQNYNNAGFNPPVYNRGVSREGDGAYSQAEMLQSIQYPTGGKTTFYFEPNTVPVSEEVFQTTTTPLLQLNINANTSPFVTTLEQTFTITQAQNIKIMIESYISLGIFNDMPNASVSATVRKSGSTTTIGGISGGPGVSQYSDVKYFNLLDPGTYILKLSANVQQESFGPSDAVIASTSIEYDQSLGVQNFNKNVGGIRLKRMVDHDGIDTLKNIDKYYLYEAPFVINPVDIKKLYFTETEETKLEMDELFECTPGSSCCRSLVCVNRVITRNSSTRYSLGTIQGGTVGYGKVTTLYGVNGINGKKVDEFSQAADNGTLEAESYPYPPIDSRDWRRGLLLKETIYNNTNIKVSEKTNSYEFLYKGGINVFKAGPFRSYPVTSVCSGIQCLTPYRDCDIAKSCYSISTEQVKTSNSVEKIYAPNGVDYITTSTNYFYDNPAYNSPTRTEQVNSKGEVLRTEMKYPYDNTGVSVYAEMLNRNMISPVIEQVQSNTTLGKELSRVKTNFQFYEGNVLVEPSTIQKSINGAGLETEATINSYDNKGNVLQITGRDGVVTSYIWGYGQYYPVAKVIGVSYADAVTLSGINLSVVANPADENSLRTELNKLRSLSGAFVSTYTYKPLIGISSETDPRGRSIYYEYDKMNRLVLVRDHDNNILKKICYNYAGQPENCLSACTNTNANWQNTATALRCQLNGSGQNTGYQEQEQKDLNPCSPTYNQLRWIVTVYNPAVCPLPPACNGSNCTGNDKKCINGVCETGVWSVISSTRPTKSSPWTCVYAYCFSDGSTSTYTQSVTSATMCPITCY